ncbi:hypothetical protein GCM10018953_45920 [Streptosporangium nondiastaticum]|uniref:GNAT family N-acetyltransferase n=1 Tax=Streptosporangium nondiastaticum TaxID=35764 RepID=UPI0031F75C0C
MPDGVPDCGLAGAPGRFALPEPASGATRDPDAARRRDLKRYVAISRHMVRDSAVQVDRRQSLYKIDDGGFYVAVSIRSAKVEDVSALVELRMANAEHHVGLGPSVHRRPDGDVVRGYFESRLRDGQDDLLLVAEMEGEAAGMAEVVLRSAPPDHQILIPRRTAEVHTVVLDRHRGRGVGRALLAAAEQTARDRGVEFLLAVIFAPNEDAVDFYSSAGFGDHGLLLGKGLGAG